MTFFATKARVYNRGMPPDSFLQELVAWGSVAPDDIFQPNPNPDDIYALISPVLSPWQSEVYRRAAMLEAMRVHAGFESSWNWNEGVDETNQHSLHNRNGEETGIFQVSFDSTAFAGMMDFAAMKAVGTVDTFIPAMKANHQLAMEYYARLVRVSIKWAGPLISKAIVPWLSRASVREFVTLIS